MTNHTSLARSSAAIYVPPVGAPWPSWCGRGALDCMGLSVKCCFVRPISHRRMPSCDAIMIIININLPVCVCVCVRHTFCRLAYKSDPSTDFYS